MYKIHFTIQYKHSPPGFEVANPGFGEDVWTFIKHLEFTVTHSTKLWRVCRHTKSYLKVLKEEQSRPRNKILQIVNSWPYQFRLLV